MTAPGLTITLFVYGMLKRGQCNHERFCRYAVDIRPASIVGRLHQLPIGFPALEIPAENNLAEGTGDPTADAETQFRFAAHDLLPTEPFGDRDMWHGELLTFPDTADDLPPLDRLEKSPPGWPRPLPSRPGGRPGQRGRRAGVGLPHGAG